MVLGIATLLEGDWLAGVLYLAAICWVAYYLVRDARIWYRKEPTLSVSWAESNKLAGRDKKVEDQLPGKDDDSFWQQGRIGLITAGNKEKRYIFLGPGSSDEGWFLGISGSHRPGFIAERYLIQPDEEIHKLVDRWQIRWLPPGRYTESVIYQYFRDWEDKRDRLPD
jgi:hypothetical protein